MSQSNFNSAQPSQVQGSIYNAGHRNSNEEENDLYSPEEFAGKLQPYTKTFKVETEMLSKHNPTLVFTFLMNTLQQKFSHLITGGAIDGSNPKQVDASAFKMVVSMEGQTNSGTPWSLRLKFQFMEYSDTMFCIRIAKMKGCQF